MISKHGAPLLAADAVDALKNHLLPATYLVTPNLPEAAALTGIDVSDESSMEQAAAAIAKFGPPHVLIKGGHLDDQALDLFWSEGTVRRLPSKRIDTQNTHGTGCVLSASITARLARGDTPLRAIQGAKRFVTEAIRTNPNLGSGYGPLNLHAPID
jgi:hydroxymethylpyrimidine kinase/phosphomethylpyrimidine kinase